MKLKFLFAYRFELFFYSLIIILFGSLIFPEHIFSTIVMPLLFVINISSGLIIFNKQKILKLLIGGMVVLMLLIFFYRNLFNSQDRVSDYIRFFVYFIFYTIMTFEIISQVWSAKQVNKTVIFGLMSGYISLGLIGFFMFSCIELVNPGSFEGLKSTGMTPNTINDLMYFSYITLMTIGYGDITPFTDTAQKASIFVAILGQFYLVIVTAVVVEKYIRDSQKD